MDSQISQKMRSHLDGRGVTKRNFHTEDPKIFGATEKNSAAGATWRLALVQLCRM